jgi:hypothetical protein
MQLTAFPALADGVANVGALLPPQIWKVAMVAWFSQIEG